MVFCDGLESKIAFCCRLDLILVSQQHSDTQHVHDDHPSGNQNDDSPLPNWDCYAVIANGWLLPQPVNLTYHHYHNF